MNQPGKVANAPRGQLNMKSVLFPGPVRALRYCGLSSQAHPSLPSPVRSFSPLGLNLLIMLMLMMLTHRMSPSFCGGVHLYRQTAIGSVPSLSRKLVMYQRRSLPRVSRYRVKVVFKVVLV